MNRSYKFRLYPNKQQAELLNKWEGSTRWLWNHFLNLEQQEYAATKKFIWRFDLINKDTMKQEIGCPLGQQ